MPTHSTTQKKYIIYDHHLEYIREIVHKQGDRLSNDIKQLLNRSVLFLQYENTYYYRDVNFMKIG